MDAEQYWEGHDNAYWNRVPSNPFCQA